MDLNQAMWFAKNSSTESNTPLLQALRVIYDELLRLQDNSGNQIKNGDGEMARKDILRQSAEQIIHQYENDDLAYFQSITEKNNPWVLFISTDMSAHLAGKLANESEYYISCSDVYSDRFPYLMAILACRSNTASTNLFWDDIKDEPELL